MTIPAPADGRDGTITVIFDPDTSQLLAWSERGPDPESVREEIVLRAAHVADIGDRP